MDYRAKVVEILDGIFDFDPEEAVCAEYRLVDDLQLTEGELETMMEELNDAFALSITPEVLVSLETVGDVIDYVSKKSML